MVAAGHHCRFRMRSVCARSAHAGRCCRSYPVFPAYRFRGAAELAECRALHRGAGVDLHILTAAGMPLQPENIVSRRGGVIVRCDGGSGASSRSECHLVRRGEGSPASALRQWSPQLDPAAVEYWGKDPDNRLAIYAPVRLNE